MVRTCVLACFFGVLTRASAQQDTLPTWKATSEVIQLFFVNLNVAVERTVPYGSHGVLLAYRPSLRSGGEVGSLHGQFGSYGNQNAWNWLYESFTLGTTNTFWTSRSRSWFVRVDGLYRRWWFDDKMARFDNDEGYRFDGLRSERQDVLALKLLSGPCRMKMFGGQRRRWLIDEAFWGLGLRWNTARFRTRNGTVGDVYREDLSETFRVTEPSLHFGFRMGLGW